MPWSQEVNTGYAGVCMLTGVSMEKWNVGRVFPRSTVYSSGMEVELSKVS